MMETPSAPSFSAARRWQIRVNVLIASLLLAVVIGLVNFLAIRYFHRFPLTRQGTVQLSQRTIQVLDSLTNDVRVTVYFDSDDDLYDPVVGLLQEYEYRSRRIQVQRVDYLRDVAAAEAVKARYRLIEPSLGNIKARPRDLVIFESNDRTKFVSSGELSDYAVEGLLTNREVARTHFKGELLFTSAIYAIASQRTPHAYFLTGHGEHSPTDEDSQTGYSKYAAGLVAENNVQVSTLTLLGTADIPVDCGLLVIAGPTQELPADELDKIQRYLSQGGRLLALFNFGSVGKNLGLEKLLGNWSIEVGDNVVIDPANSPSRTGNDVVPTEFGTHPITRPLQSSRVHLVYPRSVRKARGYAARADDPQVEELLFTGPGTLVVTDIRKGVPQPDPVRDKRGPTSLMVAVEKGSVPGLSTERGATRLVVVGDSFFWGNQMIDSAANRDFAAYCVNWLLNQTQLLGEIPRRPIKTWQLNLTPNQLSAMRWILLLGMPGLVLALGWLVWVRRRS